MAKIKPITLSGFETLNLEHPALIPDNHWADAQNMVRAADGLWENRKGIKTFDNQTGSGKPVHSIHFWKSADGTRRFTAGSGTALYSYAESAAYNDGTFTSRQGSFTDGLKFDFGQYKDYLIATNGTENMYSTTDNATWTIRNGANTRKAKYIHFANDIGVCGDVVSNRSLLYDTGAVPANPWEFPNFVEVGQDDGQVITAITNLGAVFIVGKNRSVYSAEVLTPTVEQLDYGAGVSSDRGVVKAENSVYIPSEEGVFTLAQRQGTTGSYAATPISSPMQNLWNILADKGAIAAIYYPRTREILFSVSTEKQKYTLVYNVRFQSWSYLLGVVASDWAEYETADGDFRLVYGDANGDYVRELYNEDRSDDDAPINSILTTKSFNFGTDELKTANWIEITGYGSDLMELDVELFFDEEATPRVTRSIDRNNFAVTDGALNGLGVGAIGSSALAGEIDSDSAADLDVTLFVKRIPLEETFRTIQVRLSNYQAGVRWRFKSIVLNVNGESVDLTPNYIFN